MARSDLLINLVKSYRNGDQKLFNKTVDAIIAEEKSKNHHVLADQLTKEMRKDVSINESFVSSSNELDVRNLLYKIAPEKSLEDLILSENVKLAVQQLVEEHHRVELLRSYNIEPRNKVLLLGPPGNGKTSLAESIAETLSIPFYSIRYDGLISSFLGETNQRMRKIFDFAKKNRCVLFFDEFDTLGKDRGDTHETGEIKRVVSSLLLEIDSLPPHVIVIAASNHQELLDRAVWRRFQLRLVLDKPLSKDISDWFNSFEKRVSIDFKGINIKNLSSRLKGLSYAEIEEFGLNFVRRYILEQPNASLKSIVQQQLKYMESSGIIKPLRKNARR